VETEKWLREQLKIAYPDFGIIGEEGNSHNTNARYVWVIDPIDGTRTFIHGVPLYTTLIALLDTHTWTPLIGCAYCPPTEELIYAYEGGGTHFLYQSFFYQSPHQHKKMQTNISSTPATRVTCNANIRTLDASLILSYDWVRGIDKHECILTVMKHASMTRTWADGYAYLLLASSRAQAVIDVNMHLWDIIPVYPIVKEAGGIISTPQGDALNIEALYHRSIHSKDATVDVLSAANKDIHREILQYFS